MALRIKLKNSVVQDRVPTTSDLPEVGELAVNANINSIGGFMRASDNSVVKIFGPGSLSTPTATTSVSGISELATNSETTTGTATNRVVTPAGLNAVTVAERTTSNTNYVAKSGSTLTGVLTMPNGSNSAPAINFGDSDSGIFGGTNTVSLTAGGTTRLTADTGVSVVGTLAVTGAITSTSDLTIADKIIHAGDTDTAIRFVAANTISVENAGTESARFDSAGRLLIGTSTFIRVGASSLPKLQVCGTGENAAITLSRYTADNSPSRLSLGKARGATVGTMTAVQDDDGLGEIVFCGADGTDLHSKAASIVGEVDGTPGANDLPGRLEFRTTADGAAGPTTRLTIDSAGLVKLPDNGKFVAGAGNDLQIFHDGTDSFISNATGNLVLQNTSGDAGVIGLQPKSGENAIICRDDNNVELFFDNSKKFETTSDGVSIPTDSTFLQIGAGQDLDLHHNGTNSFIRNKTGNLHIRPLVAEEGIILKPNGAIELYHDNSGPKLATTATGVNLGGGTCTFNDNGKLALGTGSDLQIFHDGSNSFIDDTGTGDTYIRGDNTLFIRGANNQDKAKFTTGGSVELYHNDSKKFQTSAEGVDIVAGNLTITDNFKARFGASLDLQIYHDGSSSFIKDTSGGSLVIQATESIAIKTNDTEFAIACNKNGGVELYHDNSLKLNTNSNGVRFHGNLEGLDNEKIRLGNSEDLQIYHDGTNTLNLIDSINGNLRIRMGTELAIQCKANDAVELYHDGSKKFETNSTGIHIFGNTSHADGAADLYGSGNDLSIVHNGSDSVIQNTAGVFFVQNTGDLRLRVNNTEAAVHCVANGAVELFHDNSKKFETTNAGFALKEGNTTRMSFSYNNSLNFITANAGNEIKVSSGNGDANGIEFWDYTGVNKRCQIDGHGIKFNADTAAANALNDYEEGTFTPTVTNGATSVTYETNGRNGSYTKIGRFVFFTIIIHMATSTGNGSGLRITGLPFTAKSFSHDNNVAGGVDPFYQDGFYNANDFSGIVVDGDTKIHLVKRSDGTALTGNDVNRGREFRMTGTYMT